MLLVSTSVAQVNALTVCFIFLISPNSQHHWYQQESYFGGHLFISAECANLRTRSNGAKKTYYYGQSNKSHREDKAHVTALLWLFCFGIRAHICKGYLLRHILLYQTVLVFFWASLHYAPLTPGGFYCFGGFFLYIYRVGLRISYGNVLLVCLQLRRAHKGYSE